MSFGSAEIRTSIPTGSFGPAPTITFRCRAREAEGLHTCLFRINRLLP